MVPENNQLCTTTPGQYGSVGLVWTSEDDPAELDWTLRRPWVQDGDWQTSRTECAGVYNAARYHLWHDLCCLGSSTSTCPFDHRRYISGSGNHVPGINQFQVHKWKSCHNWCLHRCLRNPSSDRRTYPNLDRRFCAGGIWRWCSYGRPSSRWDRSDIRSGNGSACSRRRTTHTVRHSTL